MLGQQSLTGNEACSAAAIARVAQEENSPLVSAAYGGEIHKFGSNFIIPKPFDPRLFVNVSYAVAKAAVESGVAKRPITGKEAWQAYRDQLESFIYRSNRTMQPIFHALKANQLKSVLKALSFCRR